MLFNRTFKEGFLQARAGHHDKPLLMLLRKEQAQLAGSVV
jgi:hypothetical protein